MGGCIEIGDDGNGNGRQFRGPSIFPLFLSFRILSFPTRIKKRGGEDPLDPLAEDGCIKRPDPPIIDRDIKLAR